MDDLHQPVGVEDGKEKRLLTSGVVGTTMAVLACLALGFIGYSLYKESGDGKQVVKLDSSKDEKSGSNTETIVVVDRTSSNSQTTSTQSGSNTAGANQPVFTPQRPKDVRVSSWAPVEGLTEPSEYGLLPKRGDDGFRPLDAYSRSVGTVGANRVAIVVGGLGISQTGTKKAIADLPSNITLGFSPFGNSLQRWMQLSRKEGHEVVLQLPLEPLGYPTVDPGPRTLISGNTLGQNISNLRWSLGRMTNYPLVMNYLGAGIAGQPELIKPVLEEIEKRGLAWLDDGSVQLSKSIDIAEEIGLPHATGSIVLDSVREPEKIEAQLNILGLLAKKRGFAIATATAFPMTIEHIVKWEKLAAKNDIQLVPVSSLIRDYKR